MAGLKTALPLALGMSIAGLLGGCDNGPSAVAQRSGGAEAAAAPVPGPASPAADRRRDSVKLMDGKPIWAASRRYSAEESAQRAFQRNGEAFGARSLEDYVRKARAFVERPPRGAETLTRANGDVLIYDPRANVFAVADKAGAPRTMFKPDEGGAYWQAQKDREARRRPGRAERRRDAADDEA